MKRLVAASLALALFCLLPAFADEGHHHEEMTAAELGTVHFPNETVLYAFTGNADGGLPISGVIPAGGKLYGATYQGGTGIGSGDGVVYEVNQ
jgi:hypothetical protein